MHVEKSPVVKKGGQEQRDTTGVPVSRAFVPPCNLYWRSPTLGPATCLAASRNPSRLLQIVVPRTCVDSCTPLTQARVMPTRAAPCFSRAGRVVHSQLPQELPCAGASAHRDEATADEMFCSIFVER
ncbi:Uncharacterized protein AC518_4392 [Pseudomonas syringae pv. syringae]|nr:Uncharacterized protein AC518_4392 [Pseudomonas syringae pv. syringae]RMR60421.1 hypothetical protein ALP85_102005 [Pseudomonas syringae pv. syringae]